MYICEFVNDRVQVLNPDLTFHSSLGSPGSGNGQFKYPYGVAFDSRGNVYVADWAWFCSLRSKGPHKLSLASEHSHTMDVPLSYKHHTIGVYGDTGRVIQFSVTATVLQTSSETVCLLSRPGCGGCRQFRNPLGITVDRHGLLFVSCGKNRLQIFNRADFP